MDIRGVQYVSSGNNTAVRQADSSLKMKIN